MDNENLSPPHDWPTIEELGVVALDHTRATRLDDDQDEPLDLNNEDDVTTALADGRMTVSATTRKRFG